MHGKLDPDWPEIIQRWKQTQGALRSRLIVNPLDPLPVLVAGADCALSRDRMAIVAAAVVYDRVEGRIVEIRHARRRLEFPYVPGFLSFREGPAVLEAVGKLKSHWGVICFDGQGLAHPRRCGLATHMSILLDRPGIGVAKSRFIGEFDPPPMTAGAMTPLRDADETIGVVLRTRSNVKPIFVSIGHRVDLPSAAALTMACCTRYRIPEPTRQADIEVARRRG